MPENDECETDESRVKSNETEASEIDNLPHPGTPNTTKVAKFNTKSIYMCLKRLAQGIFSY
jgi:hypothetical protein